jgi:hypothetical protein
LSGYKHRFINRALLDFCFIPAITEPAVESISMSQVAYAIMCHGSAAFVRELYRLLYTDDAHFFFHADEKSPPELKLLLAQIAVKNEKVVILPCRLCSWAGFSLTEIMLDITVAAMQREGWDHLVFLSELHLPLCSNAAIADALQTNCNYIEINPYRKMWEGARVDVAYRSAQLYYEVPGVGAFGTIAMDPGEAFYDALHHGSQWMILCRSTCAEIAAQRHAPFWEKFRHTVLADENAIQTFVAGLNTPGVTNISKSLTYVASPGKGGNAEMIFGEDLFFRVQPEGYLFIRKRPEVLPDKVELFLESISLAAAGQNIDIGKQIEEQKPNLTLATRAVLQVLNQRMQPCGIELMPMPANPSMPLFFCSTRTNGLAWPFAVYTVSQNLRHFKVLAVVHNFPKSFGNFMLGGYRVGMVRARLTDIAFHGEIHLAADRDHGFITVDTANDLDNLGAMIELFTQRILLLPQPIEA